MDWGMKEKRRENDMSEAERGGKKEMQRHRGAAILRQSLRDSAPLLPSILNRKKKMCAYCWKFRRNSFLKEIVPTKEVLAWFYPCVQKSTCVTEKCSLRKVDLVGVCVTCSRHTRWGSLLSLLLNRAQQMCVFLSLTLTQALVSTATCLPIRCMADTVAGV